MSEPRDDDEPVNRPDPVDPVDPVDEAGEDSFPASDPPPWTPPGHREPLDD